MPVQHKTVCCLHRFGQFISSTLPTFAVCEKFVVMEINNEEKIDGGMSDISVDLTSCTSILNNVWPKVYGQCLTVFLSLINMKHLVNLQEMMMTLVASYQQTSFC